MRRFLGLFLLNSHAALLAVVGALTIGLLMLDYVHSLDLLATIDAWHFDVGANCLMAVNFLTYAFGFAMPVSLALHWSKLAAAIMLGHLLVLQDLGTAHTMISTLELHFL